MTDQEWQAIISNDAEQDGVFYYAVKTTGIYCKPSCKSKTPLIGHVTTFKTREAAEAAGYRACKRCRPDSLSVTSEEAAIVTRAAESLEQSVGIILEARKKQFSDWHEASEEAQLVERIAQAAGLSTGHFGRLFKKQIGMTPKRFVMEKKIELGKKLLAETELGILEIAYICGYSSLSSFYAAFKAYTETSPQLYRNEMRQGAEKTTEKKG